MEGGVGGMVYMLRGNEEVDYRCGRMTVTGKLLKTPEGILFVTSDGNEQKFNPENLTGIQLPGIGWFTVTSYRVAETGVISLDLQG